MKQVIVLIGILALTGCSVDSDDGCGSIHSYDSEQKDATGIVLTAGGELYIDFKTVSKLYQDTQVCMGMTAIAPIVEVKDFTQHTGSTGGWGIYIFTGHRVWLNSAIDKIIPRNCASDTETLKHEYVHHILYMNASVETSRNHSNPMFAKCGRGPYVKDGVPTFTDML